MNRHLLVLLNICFLLTACVPSSGSINNEVLANKLDNESLWIDKNSTWRIEVNVGNENYKINFKRSNDMKIYGKHTPGFCDQVVFEVTSQEYSGVNLTDTCNYYSGGSLIFFKNKNTDISKEFLNSESLEPVIVCDILGWTALDIRPYSGDGYLGTLKDWLSYGAKFDARTENGCKLYKIKS